MNVSGQHLGRTIVTGANGFMGGEFLSALTTTTTARMGLVRNPVTATFTQCDYTVPALLEIFRKFCPEKIVHAAGTASVALSIAEPEADYNSSVRLSQNLIEAAIAYTREGNPAPQFLYISTAAVYGNPLLVPVEESATLAPISPYGENRLSCERSFLKYGHSMNRPTVVSRAFSVFGARQKRLVLWEIVNQVLTGNEITIQGTGEETRDFIHVDEFVRRSLRVFAQPLSQSVAVNVASGEARTINQLVETVMRLTAKQIPVSRKNNAAPGNPSIWKASIQKYQELTGDLSIPSFETDLINCIDRWRE